MIRLSVNGMERLDAISNKYRFRNYIEIEQDEVRDFCNSLIRCVNLGLNVDKEDYEFLIDVIEKL